MFKKVLLISAIIASWVSIITYNFDFLKVAFSFWVIVGVMTIVVKQYDYTRLLVALSAFTLLPSLNVSKGIFQYLNGSAVINTHRGGLTPRDTYNLDKTTRLFKATTSTGCFHGFTWKDLLVDMPYNFTTTTLVDIFGYQKGAYAGIYLDKEASQTLLENAGELVTCTYSENKISFIYQDKPYQLKFSFLPLNSIFINPIIRAKVYILNDEIVLIKLLNWRYQGFDFLDSYNIYLADAKTQDIFAKYYINNSIFSKKTGIDIDTKTILENDGSSYEKAIPLTHMFDEHIYIIKFCPQCELKSDCTHMKNGEMYRQLDLFNKADMTKLKIYFKRLDYKSKSTFRRMDC